MINVYAIWMNDGTADLDIYCDVCGLSLIPDAPIQAKRSLDEVNKIASEHVCLKVPA
jgi:hypothetical protein